MKVDIAPKARDFFFFEGKTNFAGRDVGEDSDYVLRDILGKISKILKHFPNFVCNRADGQRDPRTTSIRRRCGCKPKKLNKKQYHKPYKGQGKP